jgi:hypothetical protein
MRPSRRSRSGVDLSDFQVSFEQFANGELRDSPVPGKREPNGPFFFLFAEFAFLCADSEISTTEWTRMLRRFVETQAIFMHVYRTPPHRVPLPVDAGLLSIGAALRRTCVELPKSLARCLRRARLTARCRMP